MKVETARKVVTAHGILWSSYVDLCFIERNMIVEGNERVLSAIKTLKRFIVTGNRRCEMERITKKNIAAVENDLEIKYGFRKYQTQGRYGYIGIDEYNKNGACLRTYRTGLTKKQAYHCLFDLFNG
jgi:predicted metalloprotease with PDZ domain